MLENFYSEATNGFNHQLNLQLKVGHRLTHLTLSVPSAISIAALSQQLP